MARRARDHGGVDMSAMVKLVGDLPVTPEDAVPRRRRLLADLCKVIGDHVGEGPGGDGGSSAAVAAERGLSPRMRQTLQRLLQGNSEKEIAAQLGVSPNTVHVYVKQLYRRFGVCSRGELLAKFIRGGRSNTGGNGSQNAGNRRE